MADIQQTVKEGLQIIITSLEETNKLLNEMNEREKQKEKKEKERGIK